MTDELDMSYTHTTREILNKNVISIDMWVAVALLALFPVQKADVITPSAIFPRLAFSFSLFGVIMLAGFLIACSRLRGYRYLDMYMGCKKSGSELMPLAAISFGIAAIAFTFWIGLTPYDIVVVSTIVALSLHLNNSKELHNNKDELLKLEKTLGLEEPEPEKVI